MATNNRVPVTKVLTVLRNELKLRGIVAHFDNSTTQIRIQEREYPDVKIVLASASFPVWPMGRLKLNSVDMLPYFKVDPSSVNHTKHGILEKFWDCLRAVDGEFNNIEVQDDTILFTGVFRKVSDRELDCYRFHCRVNLGVPLATITPTSLGLHDRLL